MRTKEQKQGNPWKSTEAAQAGQEPAHFVCVLYSTDKCSVKILTRDLLLNAEHIKTFISIPLYAAALKHLRSLRSVLQVGSIY